MSTATPADVKGIIDTSLTDSEIQNFLDDAEFDADDAIADYSALSSQEKTQLEKYYAALLIRTTKEKGLESQSGESRSMNYESIATPQELRAQVDRRDPSGELATSVVTDSNRYTGRVTRSNGS